MSHNTSPLVSAASALQSADLLLFDLRDPTAYRDGHAPHALALDIKRWEQLAKTPEGDLEQAQVWAEQFGALGIDGRRAVAVYDDGRMTDAARAWFVLQWHGVDAYVVDGGWPALQRVADFCADRVEHAARPTRYEAPSGFVPQVGLATRSQLRDALGGPLQVLDARTAAEHAGEDLRNNRRGGHLPGAHLLPHAQLLQPDGSLRSAAELQALLKQSGITELAPVVTHCDGGGRAALAALAARVAGLPDVSAYYLSFADWASDETCPLERS